MTAMQMPPMTPAATAAKRDASCMLIRACSSSSMRCSHGKVILVLALHVLVPLLPVHVFLSYLSHSVLFSSALPRYPRLRSFVSSILYIVVCAMGTAHNPSPCKYGLAGFLLLMRR